MIRILIADDHPVVRQGLKQIITETSDMVVADEAGNAQEVLDKVWNNDYDVVVLDITMPGRGGLDILKQLKVEKFGLPVLILSIHPEEQYAVRALKAGAAGYLTKGSAPEELTAAIRQVSAGKKYISSSLAEKLALHLENDTDKPIHEKLSDREFQILCKIASGEALKEIAQELFLSEKTISTYRSRILDKMNMKSNAELTYYAIKNGLID